MHVGIDRVCFLHRPAGRPQNHRVVGTAINVGERFEKRFRVAAGQATGRRARFVHESGVWISCVDLMRLAILTENHFVWILLSPNQRTERTIDFDRQIVLTTVADLRSGNRTQPTIVKPHDRRPVIIQRAAFDKRFQVAADLIWNQAGHVAGQVKSMRRNIAETARYTATFGIGSPGRLLLVLAF